MNLEQKNFQKLILIADFFGITQIEASFLLRQIYQNNKTLPKLLIQKLELLENGFPLDYLLSNTEFANLKLKLNSATLIPREETLKLIEIIKIKFTSQTSLGRKLKIRNLIDLGCGSGAIGLSLISNFQKTILSDISSQALKTTEQNLKYNFPKITTNQVKILKSDLLSNLKLRKYIRSSVLVANLPYLPCSDKTLCKQNKIQFEPSLALFSGFDGLNLTKKLFLEMHFYQQFPAVLALELDPRNIKKAQKLFAKLFLKTKIYTDFWDRNRFLICY